MNGPKMPQEVGARYPAKIQGSEPEYHLGGAGGRRAELPDYVTFDMMSI